MSKRRLAPVSEHRDAAYAFLLKQETNDAPRRLATIAELKLDLKRPRFTAQDRYAVVCDARRLSSFVTGEWAARWASGDSNAANEFGATARVSFLSAQLNLHDREAAPENYGWSELLQTQLVEAYFLMLALGRTHAWQDGMLAFGGETLSEAIAEVSRQTGWTFELADPDLGEMRVGGYVAADPEAFVELLSSSLNLEARREGERRVILSRRT